MKPTRRIVPTLVAPINAASPATADVMPSTAGTISLPHAEALAPWQMAASEAYCGLKLGLPAHRRMYVDLKAQKDGVVNYAELKRKYTVMARAAGIQQAHAARSPGATSPGGGPAAARGNVFTNLIRSLELRYAQGDEDEDEEGSEEGEGESDDEGSEEGEGEEEEMQSAEEDGEAEDAGTGRVNTSAAQDVLMKRADNGSGGDDSGDETEEEDSSSEEGQEQEDANTTPSRKEANQPDQPLSGAKKRKASQPKKVRYDPDFIDDSDIARVKKGSVKAVHSGFFINKGELQVVQENGGAAQQPGRKRTAAATTTAAAAAAAAPIGAAPPAEKARANIKPKDKAVDKVKVKEDVKPKADAADKGVAAAAVNPSGAAASKKRARSGEEEGAGHKPKKVKPSKVMDTTATQPVASTAAAAAKPTAQQEAVKADAAGPSKPSVSSAAASGGVKSIAQMAALAGKAAGKSLQAKASPSVHPSPAPAGPTGRHTPGGAGPASPVPTAAATQQLSPMPRQLSMPSPAARQPTDTAAAVPGGSPEAATAAAAGAVQPQQQRRMRALQDHTSTLKAMKSKLEQAAKAVQDGGVPLKLQALKNQLGTLALSCYREGLGEATVWQQQVSQLMSELMSEGRDLAFGNPPAVDAHQLEVECAKQVEDAQRSLARLREEMKAHVLVWATQQPAATSGASTAAPLAAPVLSCLDKLLTAARKLCTSGQGKKAEAEQQQLQLQEVASWDTSGTLTADSLRTQLDFIPRTSGKTGRSGSAAPTAAGQEGNPAALTQQQQLPSIPETTLASAGGGGAGGGGSVAVVAVGGVTGGSQEAPKKRKKAQPKRNTPDPAAQPGMDMLTQAQPQQGSVSTDATEDDQPGVGSPAAQMQLDAQPSVIAIDDEATESESEGDALDQAIAAALSFPAAAQAQLTAARIREDAAKLPDSFTRNILMAALWLGPEGGTTRRLCEMFVEKKLRTEAGEVWAAEAVNKGKEKVLRKLNSKLSDTVVFIGSRTYAYVGFGVTPVEKPVRAAPNPGSLGATQQEPATQYAE